MHDCHCHGLWASGMWAHNQSQLHSQSEDCLCLRRTVFLSWIGFRKVAGQESLEQLRVLEHTGAHASASWLGLAPLVDLALRS